MVVLTLSSLVILTTAMPNGMMGGELAGIELTSAAFSHHISWSPYLIAFAAVLFAFSTALAWSYYGLTAWNYLVGVGRKRTLFFQLLFLGCLVLGCILELRAVLDFSDAMVFGRTQPHRAYLFAPMVKRELNEHNITQVVRVTGLSASNRFSRILRVCPLRERSSGWNRPSCRACRPR